MRVQYVPLPVRWRSLNIDPSSGLYRAAEDRILKRLARILAEWEGTRYDMKFASKGVGVYCSAFVCRVLEELYRRAEPAQLPKIPHDIGFHDAEGARAGLRWFMRQFPACERVVGWIEPGDVIITGPVDGGPGHAMIVGPRENTIWQSTTGSGVHYTGMALPDSYELHAAYRFSDRVNWA